MTIDKEQFATGMGLLAGAFNRSLDGAVSRAYYSILNATLTSAQFARAVALTMESETFWPSPAVLLGKVVPDTEAQGIAALEHVNRVLAQAGGHRFLSYATFHAEFDAPTKAAISAVGGLAEICNVQIERYAAFSRKFAKAYGEALQPIAVLARPSGRDLAAGVRADD